MSKLTEAQKNALEILRERGSCTAYEAKCSIATMNALVNKGHATVKRTPSSFIWPRTGNLYVAKEITA